MSDKERHLRNVQRGYASHFSSEKADEVMNSVFPELDTTYDFDLEDKNQADKAINVLRKAGNMGVTVGIRLRNYNEYSVFEDQKKDIAHGIKGCWESRCMKFDERPHTVIILSGSDNVTVWDSSLSGRIYHPIV